MTVSLAELSARSGLVFFEYQELAFDNMADQLARGQVPRLCLHFKTGAGKTATALAGLAHMGFDTVLVVAPPITHTAWQQWATLFGLTAETVSHAKFRQPGFKVSRSTPLVIDEFHQLGRHTGKGWGKLQSISRHMRVPLIICSATPNYNDAERAYCVENILDPHGTKGGFLNWLYQHCETEQNPFSQVPLVTGFKHYPNATQYLLSLDQVVYVPDDADYVLTDRGFAAPLYGNFETYGLHPFKPRVMASQMEKKHVRAELDRLTPGGNYVRDDLYWELTQLVGLSPKPVLMYCNSAKVARALLATLHINGVLAALIEGQTAPQNRMNALKRMLSGNLEVLVGTAAMATGLDGLDKVCDMMIIVHDTEDPSLRRQLIGRILPRGIPDASTGLKQVYVMHPSRGGHGKP